MAKKTRDQLKEDLKAAKEEAAVAKSEKRDFEKENKLAKGEDHSKDAKLGKKWTKLNEMQAKKDKAVNDIRTALEDAKPEKKERVSRYEYPLNEAGKEMDASEKKKYRAKMRAAAKKADKEKAGGEKKSKKADKAKESTPTTDETKKKKKGNKEEVKAED